MNRLYERVMMGQVMWPEAKIELDRIEKDEIFGGKLSLKELDFCRQLREWIWEELHRVTPV